MPNWLRLLLGALAFIVGVPLYILPVPLGIPMFIVGLILIGSRLPNPTQHLKGLRRKFPGVYKVLRPLVEGCDNCPPIR